MEFGALLQTMRPKQWTKNLFVLAPLLFSLHLFDLSSFGLSLAGFVLFSFISSAIYIINDVVDAKNDRLHPAKKNRPIASGKITRSTALITAIIIAGFSITVSFIINPSFGQVVLGYFALNIVYSFYLKRAVIVDVMTIAASFMLRIIAGAMIISVPLSEWLLICGSLLALFLGFSKRRHELSILDQEATRHRPVLSEYNVYFLDQMISLVTASTLIGYILYTVDSVTVERFGTKYLLITVPFVLYGLFRYLYLVHQKHSGGDPTAELLTDKPLLLNIFLWAVTFGLIIYLQ
jgi:4-hydroxybenzoate polyprenyltransferase